ncbi:MAG: DUF177 domain-containing protein [Oscillospiraceae bacterium]|nr:DUF177 domain-containing protein [Oscillospiraceae bacterium]
MKPLTAAGETAKPSPGKRRDGFAGPGEQIDLREVIGVPGMTQSFGFTPDLTAFLGGMYSGVRGTPKVTGKIRNSAGTLSLAAHIDAVVTATCSRCLKEFGFVIERDITASLSESPEAEEDSELYCVSDAKIDANELIVTELILDSPQSPVCREDCAGLCVKCGKDLNEGECGCAGEADPRFAALLGWSDE